uniref:G-protein coupled receptors family 3 profile domain-containing protein n=1 Tax=Acrobeloides nanus TaxID=290746 RepID=A0A914DES2_9BILA
MGSGIAQRTAGAAPANNKRRDSDSRPKSGKSHMPTENSLDELGSLYTALDATSSSKDCNKTLDSDLVYKLINASMSGPDERNKHLLSFIKFFAANSYLNEVPLNYSKTKAPPSIPPNREMPQYLLQLKCPQHRPREWKPLAVVSMKSSSDFIVVELPQLSLNACQFSNCLNSKCSWTMHSSIRVWARSCCDADQKMCRNDLRLIRAVFYVMSGLFAVGCLIMIPIVIRERRRQQQEARGWALMEIFFVGAFILYLIPLLDWLNPESASCCMAIWMRQIGFTLFYGAVILKIYRNLQEYRVRKAHHVFVRERDLLKYLAGLLALTFMGLTAWSLGAWSYDPLWTSSWPQCPMERWTMMWYVLELIFMLYGLQLCLKARNSTWVERYQFTAAVALETIVSSIINILRYLWANTASNDTLFTMYIIQLHFTISLNIAAIITPKFIIGSSEGNRRMLSMAGASSSGSKAHPSLAKLRDNLINGTIDFAEVPIIDMNPEDIRAELKRVYTQLRMYKLKNLYQDNPHISKRKGGKKTSDKTSKNRRISIPATSSSPKIRRVDEEDEKSDLTVESAPHNIYLSTNKIQLESTDLSVRV